MKRIVSWIVTAFAVVALVAPPALAAHGRTNPGGVSQYGATLVVGSGLRRE